MPTDEEGRAIWTPDEFAEAFPARMVAMGDTDGQLFCLGCSGDEQNLAPVKSTAFSRSDRCAICGVELRGARKAGRYHEYERETTPELE